VYEQLADKSKISTGKVVDDVDSEDGVEGKLHEADD
jgi:hypothetical protein